MGGPMTNPPGEQAPPMTVPVHGLTRYLRVTVAVIDRVVRWTVPRTVAGIVPIGMRRVTVPIEDVQRISIGRAFHPVRLLLGLAAMVAPWFLLPWWLAVPLLILGGWVVLTTLGPHLILSRRSGRTHRAAVCYDHQFDAELYVDVVNELSAESS